MRHQVGLLWTSEEPVAENATYTKHKRPTSMLSVGFEHTIPAIERPQTYNSDRTEQFTFIYSLH